MDQEELAGWGSNTEWADSTGVLYSTALHYIVLNYRSEKLDLHGPTMSS